MMIYGEQIKLRAMELEDMVYYAEMLNDPEISEMVVGWSFPVSERAQLQWFDRAILDKNNIRLTIVNKKNDEVLGMVTLSSIDWQNRVATHGIKLHRLCPKNKGIGTDAVKTLMRYAFEEVNLNRLESTIIDYNIASEKLYLKCGWRIEGEKKEAIFRKGSYHNLKIIGITSQDYFETKNYVCGE